jgi:hypothetical protein
VAATRSAIPSDTQAAMSAMPFPPAARKPTPADVLPGSHLVYGCPGRHSVVAPTLERRNFVTDKLRVLVRVDLDCATAQVATQGHVTSKSVHGLYAVMKRANSLTAGMALELDMTRARIEPDALEELRTCSRSHHLPALVDPLQSDYRLTILAPDTPLPRQQWLPRQPDPQQPSPYRVRKSIYDEWPGESPKGP